MRYKDRQGPAALSFVKSSKGDHLLIEIKKLPNTLQYIGNF